MFDFLAANIIKLADIGKFFAFVRKNYENDGKIG